VVLLDVQAAVYDKRVWSFAKSMQQLKGEHFQLENFDGRTWNCE